MGDGHFSPAGIDCSHTCLVLFSTHTAHNRAVEGDVLFEFWILRSQGDALFEISIKRASRTQGKIKRGDKQETVISSRGMFDDDSITVSSTWEYTYMYTPCHALANAFRYPMIRRRLCRFLSMS